MVIVSRLNHGLDLVELLVGAHTLVGFDSCISFVLTEETLIDLGLLGLVLDLKRLAVDGFRGFLSLCHKLRSCFRINFINYSFIRWRRPFIVAIDSN